ncbi:MAG: PhzF family phenazine biosynthesis protein, partial [Actinobacteria bacterium]|nr:PhzF family phenazine biosynthesis protein [Actinomycetota bacterium]
MRFVQVDVFADTVYRGNPLAVFPDAGELTGAQMQTIASEMNLSETSFVTAHTDDSYDVRIFTPDEELGFAG